MMTSSRLLEDCSRRFFVCDASSIVDPESVVDVKRCDGMLTGSLADDFLNGDDNGDDKLLERSCRLFLKKIAADNYMLLQQCFSTGEQWNFFRSALNLPESI